VRLRTVLANALVMLVGFGSALFLLVGTYRVGISVGLSRGAIQGEDRALDLISECLSSAAVEELSECYLANRERRP
jgi:hypothetical protein